MPVTVRWSSKNIPGVSLKLLAERVKSREFKKFMASLGADAVAQVRKNILERGGPGGDWPPLSDAYASHKDRMMQARDAAKAAAPEIVNVMEKRDIARRTLIKFGGDVRLRATGAVYEGLKASLFNNGLGVRVTSEGQLKGRPSNADILVWNALGTDTVPARDPTENMDRFLERWHSKLRDFLLTGRAPQ